MLVASCSVLTLSLNVMLFNACSFIRPLLLALAKSAARCCSPLVLPTSVICTDWQLLSTPSRAAMQVANSDARLPASGRY
jgi:hypothetical protein